MATPSYVDVPRPSSSMSTSEWRVAFRKTIAASFISTIKVDSPVMILSRAPIRVKMRSVGEILRMCALATARVRAGPSSLLHTHYAMHEQVILRDSPTLFRRYVAAKLSHDANDGRLAKQCRFSAHVGPG